jgi:hypothetical protein
MKQLTKQLLERAMAAELIEHVGYEKHYVTGLNSGARVTGRRRRRSPYVLVGGHFSLLPTLPHLAVDDLYTTILHPPNPTRRSVLSLRC